MKYIRNFNLKSLNEDISEIDFNKAIKNIKELSEYLEIDEKKLMEIIYFNFGNENEEKITSLAYSYGLI